MRSLNPCSFTWNNDGGDEAIDLRLTKREVRIGYCTTRETERERYVCGHSRWAGTRKETIPNEAKPESQSMRNRSRVLITAILVFCLLLHLNASSARLLSRYSYSSSNSHSSIPPRQTTEDTLRFLSYIGHRAFCAHQSVTTHWARFWGPYMVSFDCFLPQYVVFPLQCLVSYYFVFPFAQYPMWCILVCFTVS